MSIYHSPELQLELKTQIYYVQSWTHNLCILLFFVCFPSCRHHPVGALKVIIDTFILFYIPYLINSELSRIAPALPLSVLPLLQLPCIASSTVWWYSKLTSPLLPEIDLLADAHMIKWKLILDSRTPVYYFFSVWFPATSCIGLYGQAVANYKFALQS